jgi:hypothetical protein
MVNMILTTAEIVVPNENDINLHNAEMTTMGCIMSYEHGRMISNRILVIIIKVQTMKEMFDWCQAIYGYCLSQSNIQHMLYMLDDIRQHLQPIVANHIHKIWFNDMDDGNVKIQRTHLKQRDNVYVIRGLKGIAINERMIHQGYDARIGFYQNKQKISLHNNDVIHKTFFLLLFFE